MRIPQVLQLQMHEAAESESTPHEPPCVAAVVVVRVRLF